MHLHKHFHTSGKKMSILVLQPEIAKVCWVFVLQYFTLVIATKDLKFFFLQFLKKIFSIFHLFLIYTLAHTGNFLTGNFAQVEFEDCAHDHIRNKTFHDHIRSYHVHMIILEKRFAQQSNQSSNRAVQEPWPCPQHVWESRGQQMLTKNPDSTAPLTSILNGCGSTCM